MVVRMRHTRAHTKNRRSHHALKQPTLSTCSHCGAAHRPHHMCLDCGFYKGKQVMDVKAKKEARDARLQAKREAIKAQATEAEAAELPAAPEEAPAEVQDTKSEETQK